MSQACPFCGAPAAKFCSACGRDPTATRRPCVQCRRLTPSQEPLCCHCGARFKSKMRWKIPLIIGLFLLAFLVSLVLALVK